MMDASQNYREVPSMTELDLELSLTFDIGAFGTPQTVLERSMSVD